ncbi:NUDIX domain-containing protein [Streptomyces lydicus]|uniref:NUDIX domain-containing protein n=1 Tax=Streptomyces lydicus TaxID=47763 RepID=UPI0037D155BF
MKKSQTPTNQPPVANGVRPAAPLVTVEMVITDPYRRILMVTPRRAPSSQMWQLPGGIVRQGESPRQAVEWAVKYQLGLHLRHNGIAAVTWTQVSTAESPEAYRVRVRLTFTAPRLSLTDVARIRPQAHLVRAVQWAERSIAQQRLGPGFAEGLRWTHTQSGPAYAETRLASRERTFTC